MHAAYATSTVVTRRANNRDWHDYAAFLRESTNMTTTVADKLAPPKIACRGRSRAGPSLWAPDAHTKVAFAKAALRLGIICPPPEPADKPWRSS